MDSKFLNYCYYLNNFNNCIYFSFDILVVNIGKRDRSIYFQLFFVFLKITVSIIFLQVESGKMILFPTCLVTSV